MLVFPPTMSYYIAKSYFASFIFLFFILLAIVYLFDTVELVRRASKFDDIPLSLVLQMGLYKLPEVGQILLPFAVLFSAIYTFWLLTRRYELVVARAAGFSVWQFLGPVIGVALFIGVMQITVINPISALLISRFEQLENIHLNRSDNEIAVFKEGLWLRQKTDNDGSYVILHAPRIDQKEWKMEDVTAIFFDTNDNYIQHVESEVAFLESERWVFRNTVIHRSQDDIAEQESFVLPTRLTAKDIEDSFASPQSMAFWRLPSHIKTLEESGFDASRLKVHYHNLLAQPLLLAAMILLAAAVSLRPPRFRGTVVLIGIGVFIGFLVFFISSFLQALGASQQIPPLMAAWTPSVICFLLGVSAMINLEDG